MSYHFKNKGLALSGLSRAQSREVEGFTLIEMIVVIAIFGIVTTVVLANLPVFRDRSSLDLVAQEVAINIRGAQVYGASGRVQANPGSKPTWRIVFNKSNFTPPSKFQLFRYDINQKQPAETYTLASNFALDSMCLIETSGGQCNTKNVLGIAFTRPNLEPSFYDEGNLVPNAVSAQIVVKALRSGETRQIEVYNNGQISVINPKSNINNK